MKKHISIKSKVNSDQILTNLNKLIQEPKVSFLDLGLKKKYSGEINNYQFWFTWSKTMDLTKGRPTVKGQILKLKDGCEVKMKIKDSSITSLTILFVLIFIPIVYFAVTIIKSHDYNGLIIILGISFLLIFILLFNYWRAKRSMVQLENEIFQIFDH